MTKNEKISQALRGRRLSSETKEKISRGVKATLTEDYERNEKRTFEFFLRVVVVLCPRTFSYRQFCEHARREIPEMTEYCMDQYFQKLRKKEEILVVRRGVYESYRIRGYNYSDPLENRRLLTISDFEGDDLLPNYTDGLDAE